MIAFSCKQDIPRPCGERLTLSGKLWASQMQKRETSITSLPLAYNSAEFFHDTRGLATEQLVSLIVHALDDRGGVTFFACPQQVHIGDPN